MEKIEVKDHAALNAGLPAGVSQLPFRHGEETEGVAGSREKDDSVSLPIPWRYRIPAFCLILLFGTGASFADVTIGPLKSTLLREFGINNAQFSTINTAVNIVNTILPIVGGLTMDYIGGVHAALIFSIFSVTGCLIAAASANTGKVGMLIGGRIIMGFGSVVLETSQYKLYTHWFSGAGLGLAIAIDLAWISVTSVCARLAAVPMSRINGWYGYALWIPNIVTVASFLAVVGYWFLERSMPAEFRPSNGANIRAKQVGGRFGVNGFKFAWKNMLALPMFFWIFAGTELFQNSARTVYSANLANMQELTRGTSTLAAGYNASLQNVVSIVMAPLIGIFIDRFGWRMPFISISAALYIFVFATIGLTTINPTGPIVVSSIALAANVMPIQTALPVFIHNEDLMGTAFGTWSAFIACNNIILEIATGTIQDKTPGKSYNRVIIFLIAIKAFQIFLGPFYDYLDGKLLRHSLRKNEKTRIALKNERLREENLFKGWEVKRWATWVFGGQLCCMILASWVIYLTYTVGGVSRS